MTKEHYLLVQNNPEALLYDYYREVNKKRQMSQSEFITKLNTLFISQGKDPQELLNIIKAKIENELKIWRIFKDGKFINFA